MKSKVLIFVLGFASTCAFAYADVSIETSVSRTKLPVGEQLVLDIIISDAQGRIERPRIDSIDGFTSSSQGHSQEFSIINGQTTSRSIYSYVLVANSTGEKIIGPFQIAIGGKEYKVAPVKVEVLQTGISPQSSYTWAQAPVVSPSPRAIPVGGSVGEQDIFVKAWLDKDEVYVNEPLMVTYTLFTRLSATYKGFEKEPVTTGFWVEDFPPEKTVRRTEQFLNGQRYVVADVRKMALFPTQAGIFTLEPGILSATVEVRSGDNFQTFFSGNIFGSRRASFPGTYVSEIVPKVLPTEPVRLTVKALPEAGKTPDFSGAVGRFEIESSLDKQEVEAGDPVTLRVRIRGKGNINTVQSPKPPRMDDFKVYDSSSSTNISKERLVVEGEKVTETVIVPRKPGTYAIPSMAFTYFDPQAGEYRTVNTEAHTLRVSGTAQPETSSNLAGSSAVDTLFETEQEDAALVAKDIRYLKSSDDGKSVPKDELYRSPLYWLANGALFLIGLLSALLAGRRATDLADSRGSRLRRSHAMARSKLKAAARLMKESKSEPFYAEISRAVTGYFADKFNIPAQAVSQQRLEELAGELVTAEQMNKMRKLFDEMSMGRFARVEKSREDMQELYELADEVLTAFEKVKLK